MGLSLHSDIKALTDGGSRHGGSGLTVLLTTGDSRSASAIEAVHEELLVIDVTGPNLSRLNFDVISTAIVDLTPDELISSGGRRLIDVLGRLAKESLTLAFYGPATAMTGSLLQDGATAGLNLVPHCVVIPDVPAVSDLNSLLASLSGTGVRILALDGPVSAHYRFDADTITAEGQGSVLLAAFRRGEGCTPTARLHLLSAAKTSAWPA